MTHRCPWALPLLAVTLLAASGCETLTPSTCDPSAANNPTVGYAGGQTADGVYMSSPWDGELLDFPGGAHYALEHRLGGTPAWVMSYLSFDEFGTRSGGSLAQAAGNQVLILGVDDETITVANDSCVAYWLLVTAGVGVADGGAPPGP
jgi:hypothetical protein